VTSSVMKRERNRTVTPVRAATAMALVGGLMALAPLAPVASAQTTKSKSATVVQVVTRTSGAMTFTNMLATVPGLSLYVDTNSSPCTKGCLTVWPPLHMPKGKTMPLGATGLGTVKMGRHRQVTLNGKRLYTFNGDSGTSVNGENVGGFIVAQEP